jgi:hypothetical protein
MVAGYTMTCLPLAEPEHGDYGESFEEFRGDVRFRAPPVSVWVKSR